MKVNEQAIRNFTEKKYPKVRRDEYSYEATQEYVVERVEQLKQLYGLKQHPQTLRLIRDEIDRHLRRYHEYCIQQRIGAHYREITQEKTVFEHVIPNSTVRDLVLEGALTVIQACNMPTCQLSVSRDKQLRNHGFTSCTPDIFCFWQRYENCFSTVNCFQTWQGDVVHTESWNLQSHFDLVFDCEL